MLERTACSGRKQNILVYFGRKDQTKTAWVEFGGDLRKDLAQHYFMALLSILLSKGKVSL